MKSTLFTILFIALSFIVKGQKNTLPLFYDFRLIDSIVDSLLISNTSEIVVFQTDKSFHHLKSEDGVLTFICWKQNERYQVKIISNYKIYPTVYFDGKKIFNFRAKLKTFVDSDEQVLKFVPPITTSNTLFYFALKNRGYFELPDSNTNSAMTYNPVNLKKEKLRRQWFEIIYQILLTENFNLIFKIITIDTKIYMCLMKNLCVDKN